MATDTKKISTQVNATWKRLAAFYGTKLVEQYGAIPSDDWCEVIDRANREKIDRAFAACRARHPVWPPTLPQFEAAMNPAAAERQVAAPSLMDQLDSFVRKNYLLTNAQWRRWTWLYAGKPWLPDYRITGVQIPADGDAPGYRVMVADMEAVSDAA